jgi:hypothetical protein
VSRLPQVWTLKKAYQLVAGFGCDLEVSVFGSATGLKGVLSVLGASHA